MGDLKKKADEKPTVSKQKKRHINLEPSEKRDTVALGQWEDN